MSFSAKAVRLAKLAAAAGLAAGSLMLAAPAASASGGVGWLRLAHLSPNTPAVDVYLYSFGNPSAQIVLHHVSYGTVSGFEQVPAGEYTVAMRAAGAAASSKPVLSTSIDVIAGHAYTVAGMGPYSGLRLQVIPDRLTTPKGKALVRVIQASLQEQKVTVTAAGKTIADKLPFSDVTAFQAVSPGTWAVHAAGATESTTADITLAVGTIHTIVVLDDPSRLALDDLTDAAGSKVLPAGAAQTGFGGTAPRPGGPLLPWVAIGSAGLLLIAGGATRLRRARVLAIRAR
ncbi:MAG: DUF4397 domain-containing protein [Streptosporangiaceae bacterium]